MWSNHTEVTRNCEEFRCGRTTLNSLEAALYACFPLHHSGSRRSDVVEPPQTHWNLPCRPSSPFIAVFEPLLTHSELPSKSAYPVVEGGSVWLNHPKLTRNCPIRLLPNGSKWFGEVRCG